MSRRTIPKSLPIPVVLGGDMEWRNDLGNAPRGSLPFLAKSDYVDNGWGEDCMWVAVWHLNEDYPQAQADGEPLYDVTQWKPIL